MEKRIFDNTEYARIEGVGMIALANPDERMTIHQAINAKSYQGGLPTKYNRIKKGYLITEHMRCFISICRCRLQEYKDSPNRGRFEQPSCF